MVLVILAILAAIMVPALTGWIDKAKEKQLIVTGRTIMLAGQSAASEAYAATDPSNKTITTAKVNAYLEDEGITGTWSITFVNYKVDTVKYSDGSKIVTYNGGSWTSADTGTVDGANTATPGNETVHS